MSSKLQQLVLQLFIQSWRPLANYAVKAGVVCLQVKLCDSHLSALEVRFSRRGAIQIDHIYLFEMKCRTDHSIAVMLITIITIIIIIIITIMRVCQLVLLCSSSQRTVLTPSTRSRN